MMDTRSKENLGWLIVALVITFVLKVLFGRILNGWRQGKSVPSGGAMAQEVNATTNERISSEVQSLDMGQLSIFTTAPHKHQ
jgi:hypothetical protein